MVTAATTWTAAAEAPLATADLISALSYALDLTGGQAAGWAVRTCRIGMRLAEVIGLPEDQRGDLYYALLLKDTGCSSNAARMAQLFGHHDHAVKRDSLLVDWRRLSLGGLRTALRLAEQGENWPRRLRRIAALGVHRQRDAQEVIQLRCERGAAIALRMGFRAATAEAIAALDERWDGRGAPRQMRGEEIPLLGRILRVAHTLALFPTAPERGLRALKAHRGWFDPALVRAARQLRGERRLWEDRPLALVRQEVIDLDPGGGQAAAPARQDEICQAFADVVDAKSPFTYHHSRRVAAAAAGIAAQLGFPGSEATLIHRAALLHDIGKLGVSNRILDKAGPLTPGEWRQMQQHPVFTYRILAHVSGWDALARIASLHHERLDGRGYPMGLGAAELPLAARVIAVADVYDALSADRPYRAAIPHEQVMSMLDRDCPHALDGDCVAALRATLNATPR